MPTTSNFGWTTPADTDLVKDGAAAIRTLGSAIDTSFLDLKGGTTGQNLRKNSNTDLDFTWAGDATNTVIDAEGDLLVGDSADTLQRLAIGTTGQVLTVDTTIDGKIKWAATAAGGYTFAKIGSDVTLSGASTQLTGISNKNALFIYGTGILANTTSIDLDITVNNNTTAANYAQIGYRQGATSSYDGGVPEWDLINLNNTTGSNFIIALFGCNGTSVKTGYAISSEGGQTAPTFQGLVYYDTTAITTVEIRAGGGTFSGGTVKVYGA